MKRHTFKNWVSYTLMFISIIAVFVLGTDQMDWYNFLLVHGVALLVIIVNTILLILFGKDELFNERI